MEKINEVIESVKTKEIVDIGIAVGSLVLFIFLSSIFAKIIMRCLKMNPNRLSKKSKVYKMLKFIWIISGTYVSLLILRLPQDFMAIITKIFKLSMIYGLTRLCANLVRPSSKILSRVKEDDDDANEHTINFAIKFVRGIIYVIGAFIFISELGYDLSGLITGLGIGSVVLALAAQDLAKNLFGGFAILTDKTFSVGDTIEVKGVFGTVEDITFRTTRIRKLDDTVITMPNSILADSDIINWNKIEKRRYDCELKLSLEMPQIEINKIKSNVINVLEENENVIKGSVRAYFSEISKDGYIIKIYLYTSITNYDEYIEFINNINSQIISVLEHKNVKLINPTYDINLNK